VLSNRSGIEGNAPRVGDRDIREGEGEMKVVRISKALSADRVKPDALFILPLMPFATAII
jgi:hypothetical protein